MLVVWILLAVLAGLTALLAVPVELSFCVQRHEGRQVNTGSFGWLFGLVRLHLGEPKVAMAGSPKEAKAKPPKDKRRKPKHGGGSRIMAILRIEGFGWRLLRLAQDLLRHIQIRDLSLDVRLGLDDPADTGWLWAVIGPLHAILTLPTVTHLAIEPEFTSEVFEVDARGRIRIIPIQLLWVILVFALSPGTLRALHTMRLETG